MLVSFFDVFLKILSIPRRLKKVTELIFVQLFENRTRCCFVFFNVWDKSASNPSTDVQNKTFSLKDIVYFLNQKAFLSQMSYVRKLEAVVVV